MKNFSWIERIVITSLVAMFLALGITSIAQKSPTSDELAHHIPAGYVFLRTGDLAFSTETPPLSRYISTIPLFTLDLQLPKDRGFWARGDRAEFSREFVYSLNRSYAGVMVFLSRLPMLLLAVFGGIFLFNWVKKHYGSIPSLFAAVIYFNSPNIMASARLATTDTAAMVFIMCSVLSFWDLFLARDKKNMVFSGVFLGLALLSKYSAFLLVPVYFIMGIAGVATSAGEENSRKGMLRNLWILSVFFGIAFLVLWAGYGFEFKPLLQNVLRADAKSDALTGLFAAVAPFAGESGLKAFEKTLWTVPIPLSSYLIGFLGVLKHGAEGTRVFFAGEWCHTGHPAYYVVAMLIKMPIPVLLSFLLSFVTVFKEEEKQHRPSAWYLLSIIFIFGIAASRANLQLGVRYLLPIFPLIFIFAARAGVYFFLKSGLRRMVVYGFCLWLVAGQFFIWPDYLSYFNVLAGGPSGGYRYLRDSNIDWGQDLPALKRYLDSKGIEAVRLDYFGEGDPSFYGINALMFSEEEFIIPGPFVYAVSVHGIDKYPWALSNKPSARAGYSIYIYDFREKE